MRTLKLIRNFAIVILLGSIMSCNEIEVKPKETKEPIEMQAKERGIMIK